MKINSEWINDLSLVKIIKIPEENKGSILITLGLDNDFFDMTAKV